MSPESAISLRWSCLLYTPVLLWRQLFGGGRWCKNALEPHADVPRLQAVGKHRLVTQKMRAALWGWAV